MTWIIATKNKGKYQEFSDIFSPKKIVLKPLPEDFSQVDEVGLTYVENALLKAREACRRHRPTFFRGRLRTRSSCFKRSARIVFRTVRRNRW